MLELVNFLSEHTQDIIYRNDKFKLKKNEEEASRLYSL